MLIKETEKNLDTMNMSSREGILMVRKKQANHCTPGRLARKESFPKA